MHVVTARAVLSHPPGAVQVQRKNDPDVLSLGTCMEMSGAAISATLGIFSQNSWTVQLAEAFVAMLGLETGR